MSPRHLLPSHFMMHQFDKKYLILLVFLAGLSAASQLFASVEYSSSGGLIDGCTLGLASVSQGIDPNNTSGRNVPHVHHPEVRLPGIIHLSTSKEPVILVASESALGTSGPEVVSGYVMCSITVT
ncbi:hypothetical protein OBBRIDRAFT_840041 [Obba rivulosa]|uniref:Uncharacterized protein n=1 Tax=Obba rivulosa TaxID=1052685 RepID=A0A8E2AIE8_9APHY|nr:hypothetical protein OBBRIDRAFT_840041 [Obba rivulosa]